jgi:cysteine desulfurase
VLQPIAPIAKACQDRGIVFHTDAVQAVGKIALGLDAVPIDLLSLSAHKLGGPAGVGVLYNRRAVDVAALTPGHQENGRRGGTPSVAFALATAEALEHALANQVAYARRLEPLRDRFEAEVSRRFGAIVNGAGAPRVPNTANVTFPGLDGEALLIALDLDGIAASTGAACASGSLSPSQVLLAMGLEAARARSTLRFSLGPEATDDEVSTVLGALERHVDACRMGPTR